MNRISFISAFVIIFSFASVASSQSFNIQPANPVLSGEPITISLTGLPTNAEVKITAERVVVAYGQAKPTLYRADAVYTTSTDGKLDLVAVEYIAFKGPAALEGQLFNFVTEPNRYGLDKFYELHVWAWKPNSAGSFADNNPNVSCEAMKEATP